MNITEKIKHLNDIGISCYRIHQDTKNDPIPLKKGSLSLWLNGKFKPSQVYLNAFNAYFEKVTNKADN